MNNIIKEKPWFKEILKKPELQDITLRNLYEFYLSNSNIYTILPILTSESNISIRVLDWFVTNYSKKNNIIYELKNQNNNGDKYFNVYLQYKCQLKAYKKKLFDPFCRKQRIAFHYEETKCVVTTIGQLNFFKWAIMYNVLNYVENNLSSITDDMITSNKNIIKKYNSDTESDSKSKHKAKTDISTYETNKSNTYNPSTESTSDTHNLTSVAKSKNTKSNNSDTTDSEKIRRKRHELSHSANKTINIHNYSIVLTFD